MLLDSGSSCSYVSERLATRLYLTGKNKNVAVGVLGGNVMEDILRVVHLSVQHADGNKQTELEAYVLAKVTPDLGLVNWNKLKSRWSHRADIDFQEPGDANLDMLIGLNSAILHRADEERHSRDGDPIASCTSS